MTAIMPADIEFVLSMGTTGSSGAQTDPRASRGGTISTTLVSPNINNIWDDTSLVETEAGRVEYRMLYVRLRAGIDMTLSDAVIWVEVGPDGLDVALDPAAIGANSTTTTASETAAPSGVVFAGTAVSLATALAIGTLAPGDKKAFWEKRTTVAGAPSSIKVPSIRVSGVPV